MIHTKSRDKFLGIILHGRFVAFCKQMWMFGHLTPLSSSAETAKKKRLNMPAQKDDHCCPGHDKSTAVQIPKNDEKGNARTTRVHDGPFVKSISEDGRITRYSYPRRCKSYHEDNTVFCLKFILQLLIVLCLIGVILYINDRYRIGVGRNCDLNCNSSLIVKFQDVPEDLNMTIPMMSLLNKTYNKLDQLDQKVNSFIASNNKNRTFQSTRRKANKRKNFKAVTEAPLSEDLKDFFDTKDLSTDFFTNYLLSLVEPLSDKFDILENSSFNSDVLPKLDREKLGMPLEYLDELMRRMNPNEKFDDNQQTGEQDFVMKNRTKRRILGGSGLNLQLGSKQKTNLGQIPQLANGNLDIQGGAAAEEASSGSSQGGLNLSGALQQSLNSGIDTSSNLGNRIGERIQQQDLSGSPNLEAPNLEAPKTELGGGAQQDLTGNIDKGSKPYKTSDATAELQKEINIGKDLDGLDKEVNIDSASDKGAGVSKEVNIDKALDGGAKVDKEVSADKALDEGAELNKQINVDKSLEEATGLNSNLNFGKAVDVAAGLNNNAKLDKAVDVASELNNKLNIDSAINGAVGLKNNINFDTAIDIAAKSNNEANLNTASNIAAEGSAKLRGAINGGSLDLQGAISALGANLKQGSSLVGDFGLSIAAASDANANSNTNGAGTSFSTGANNKNTKDAGLSSDTRFDAGSTYDQKVSINEKADVKEKIDLNTNAKLSTDLETSSKDEKPITSGINTTTDIKDKVSGLSSVQNSNLASLAGAETSEKVGQIDEKSAAGGSLNNNESVKGLDIMLGDSPKVEYDVFGSGEKNTTSTQNIPISNGNDESNSSMIFTENLKNVGNKTQDVVVTQSDSQAKGIQSDATNVDESNVSKQSSSEDETSKSNKSSYSNDDNTKDTHATPMDDQSKSLENFDDATAKNMGESQQKKNGTAVNDDKVHHIHTAAMGDQSKLLENSEADVSSFSEHNKLKNATHINDDKVHHVYEGSMGDQSKLLDNSEADVSSFSENIKLENSRKTHINDDKVYHVHEGSMDKSPKISESDANIFNVDDQVKKNATHINDDKVHHVYEGSMDDTAKARTSSDVEAAKSLTTTVNNDEVPQSDLSNVNDARNDDTLGNIDANSTISIENTEFSSIESQVTLTSNSEISSSFAEATQESQPPPNEPKLMSAAEEIGLYLKRMKEKQNANTSTTTPEKETTMSNSNSNPTESVVSNSDVQVDVSSSPEQVANVMDNTTTRNSSSEGINMNISGSNNFKSDKFILPPSFDQYSDNRNNVNLESPVDKAISSNDSTSQTSIDASVNRNTVTENLPPSISDDATSNQDLSDNRTSSAKYNGSLLPSPADVINNETLVSLLSDGTNDSLNTASETELNAFEPLAKTKREYPNIDLEAAGSKDSVAVSNDQYDQLIYSGDYKDQSTGIDDRKLFEKYFYGSGSNNQEGNEDNEQDNPYPGDIYKQRMYRRSSTKNQRLGNKIFKRSYNPESLTPIGDETVEEAMARIVLHYNRDKGTIIDGYTDLL